MLNSRLVFMSDELYPTSFSLSLIQVISNLFFKLQTKASRTVIVTTIHGKCSTVALPRDTSKADRHGECPGPSSLASAFPGRNHSLKNLLTFPPYENIVLPFPNTAEFSTASASSHCRQIRPPNSRCGSRLDHSAFHTLRQGTWSFRRFRAKQLGIKAIKVSTSSVPVGGDDDPQLAKGSNPVRRSRIGFDTGVLDQ